MAVTVRAMLRLFNERGIASLNAQPSEIFYGVLRLMFPAVPCYKKVINKVQIGYNNKLNEYAQLGIPFDGIFAWEVMSPGTKQL